MEGKNGQLIPNRRLTIGDSRLVDFNTDSSQVKRKFICKLLYFVSDQCLLKDLYYNSFYRSNYTLIINEASEV